MTGKEVIDKKQQRRLAIERRRALTQEERDEKSRAICDLLIKLIKDPRYSGVRTIFSYRGTWDEVNVDAFNDWAERQGYRVAYPISLTDGIMKARQRKMPGIAPPMEFLNRLWRIRRSLNRGILTWSLSPVSLLMSMETVAATEPAIMTAL